ncbi:MAG: hypothetical protein R2827_10300 [Bdellovibrionales bacterium]
MRAQLKTVDDISVVYLSGKMNLDSAEEFQIICEHNLGKRKLIFGLEGLSFVGSTGITIFLDTLNEYHQRSTFPVKMFSVSSEFDRIFSANLDNYTQFASESQAILSCYPQQQTETQPTYHQSYAATSPAVNGASQSEFFGMRNSVVGIQDEGASLNLSPPQEAEPEAQQHDGPPIQIVDHDKENN